MLGRLQVREKLTLLVVVPLVAVALLLVPLLAGRLDVARAAGSAATTAELARSTSLLVEDLRRVRLLAVGFVVGSGGEGEELTVALADVAARRDRLVRDAEAAGYPELAAAARDEAVSSLGRDVLRRTVGPEQVVDAVSAQVDALVDGLRLADGGFDATARPLAALDLLLRSDESASRGGALLLVAAAAEGADRREALAAASDELAASAAFATQFARQAEPDVAGLLEEARTGPSGSRLAAARTAVASAPAPREVPLEDLVGLYDAVTANDAARLLVETRVAQGVASTATTAAAQARLSVYVVGGVVGGLFLLVVALTVVVGRSVSRPLRRLTTAAGRVAELAQEELLRVSDEDRESAGAVRLAAVDVASSDEIGALGDAFNRVQATAALLLERQVQSRRNVATMFAGVGRRTTNLVGRQLALIDRLERTEEDPDTLELLYRLDHVSTRLRRNASSLVVLSGGTEGSGDGRPVALADALRAALGSVEEYQRVTIGRLPGAFVAPGTAPDLMLLLAELMENAVLFSPPSSAVEVSAERLADGGAVLRIADHGLGMSPERFAEENARLRRRERLDVAPTEVLGLFVVGRIARRHGLAVHLEPTADQGVTAVVTLPPAALVEAPVLPPARVEARRAEGRRPERERVVAAPSAPAPAAAPAHRAPTAAAAQGPVTGPTQVLDEVIAQVVAPVTARSRPAEGDEAEPAAEPEPSAADVAGVPRRVPGAHLGAESAPAGPPPAARQERRPSGPDPARARQELDDLEAAVRDADRAARPGARPERTQPAASGGPADPPAAPPGVRRRVPGQALEAFDAPATTVASPREVDAEEVRAALDDVKDAEHQVLVRPPERTVRTQRREAQAQQPPAEAPAAGAAAPEPAGEPLPRLARRRPGEALAALEEADAAGEAAPPARAEAVGSPERPEEVLAWADDLQSAMTQVDDLLGLDRELPARAPDDTGPIRLRAASDEPVGTTGTHETGEPS